MAFFKFRQRGPAQAQPQPEPTGRRSRKNEPAPAGPQESIDTVRRRARHRLLGAVVLVGIAVVGFPLLFDTQPRPVAVNAPITIPDKDTAPPLQGPQANGRSVPASASLGEREEMVVAGAAAGAASERAPDAAASAASTARERTASESTAQQRARQEAEAKAKREEATRTQRDEEAARAQREQQAKRETADAERRAKAEQEAKAKREAEAKRAAESNRDADSDAADKREAEAKRLADAKTKREAEAKAKREAEAKAKRDEAARARALLEGRSAAADAKPERKPDEPAAKGRFIVQVGAFADDAATRQARQKAEAAGVKTYTQVVETSAGKRTRVRVGPFGSREEAEKAAAALKKAGLGGAVLGL